MQSIIMKIVAVVLIASLQLMVSEASDSVSLALEGATGDGDTALDRMTRRQDREDRRRRADQKRSNREKNRRQRVERRRQQQTQEGGGSSSSSTPFFSTTEEPLSSMDQSWLAANLSSLWLVVRRLQQQHRFTLQSSNRSVEDDEAAAWGSEVACDQSPSCRARADQCQSAPGEPVCSSRGSCCCGSCHCEAPYYGLACECGEDLCEFHNGVVCGGRGNCECNRCVCDAGYTGGACECSSDIEPCTDQRNGLICNNRGVCQCGRCKCDTGMYAGVLCEESLYSAGLCEQLKPCVLCKALGRSLPQCTMCGHVTVQRTAELQSSHTMCRMVHGGCLMQYTYVKEGDTNYLVKVPEDMGCQ